MGITVKSLAMEWRSFEATLPPEVTQAERRLLRAAYFGGAAVVLDAVTADAKLPKTALKMILMALCSQVEDFQDEERARKRAAPLPHG